MPPSTQTPAVHELTAEQLAAWRGLLRVHSALVKSLDAELIAGHELPLSSYEVLINLQAAPRARRRMAELADSVLLSRSGMTRLVDRLEREGLLERDTCASDAPRHLRGADRRGRGHAAATPARRTSTASASVSCATSRRASCARWPHSGSASSPARRISVERTQET